MDKGDAAFFSVGEKPGRVRGDSGDKYSMNGFTLLTLSPPTGPDWPLLVSNGGGWKTARRVFSGAKPPRPEWRLAELHGMLYRQATR